MKPSRLTKRPHAATTRAMRIEQGDARSSRRALRTAAMLLGGAAALSGALSGCISVNAPDKPIVIELNINIKQEVIYRLAADAEKTIDENAGIF